MLLSRHISRTAFIIAVLIATSLWGSSVMAQDSKLGDMIFDRNKESMDEAGVGVVTFPHTLHEEKWSCDECHPDVFSEKLGENEITMQTNMDGDHCGLCHNGTMAFPLFKCAKCHEHDQTGH